MKQPIKMTPGDELHLTALMAPFSLNLVTVQDRQHLLGYGRAAFEAGKAGQCLHQIQEPAAAEQAAWHAGLDEGRAQAGASQRAMVRYCPECGHVGEVGAGHRDCCPDGSQAFMVPEKHAKGLRAGFLAQIAQAAPAAVAVADERAAFEAWASTQYAEINLARDGDEYRYALAKDWWPVWKASRAALSATPAAAPVVLPEPDGFLESHPLGSIYHRGKPSQMQTFCGACPPMYEAGTVHALLATATGLPAQAVDKPEGVHAYPYPRKCPVTGRRYFMHLQHPVHGLIPTFGGPYDSYSMPYAEGEPTDPWHERELSVHRYDHDRGHWVEDESIPLRIIFDEALWKLQEASEAAPQAQADARDAERYRFIVSKKLILSGGTEQFGWPIAPFGSECDRYIDAAIAAAKGEQQ